MCIETSLHSHIGIIGKEKADQTAKSALNFFNITAIPLFY